MEILFFFAFIGLLFWNINLASKVDDLERKIFPDKKKGIFPEGTFAPDTSYDDEDEEIEKIPKEDKEEKKTLSAVSSKNPTTTSSSAFQVEDFLGRKFFSILGIISVVLAVGFFTMWAFSSGLIGPLGRVFLGIAASLILLFIGELKRNSLPDFYTLFSAGGIAGLIFVTFVARDFYDFLSASQSFIFYMLEVGVGLLLSLRYNSRVLGNLAIAGGLLAPILVKSPDPNAIGLLTFLSILSVAGFALTTQKKWPEIGWILFLGIVGFELKIFNTELLKNQPVIFLSFIFGLHALLGSGGVVRCIKEKIEQKIHQSLEDREVSEILLLVVSLFVANFIALRIFDQQGWTHFGFFVLAEGVFWLGFSEFCRIKKLALFQSIGQAAALLSVLFATVWELESKSDFALTTLLIAEGALFCFAARKTKNVLFHFFGGLALLIASFWLFALKGFGENTIAVVLLVASLLYSVEPKSKKEVVQLWSGIVFFLASLHLFIWNYSQWTELLSEKTMFLGLLFPVLWSTGVTYSILKTKSNTSLIGGLCLLFITNLTLWVFFWEEFNRNLLYVPLLALIFVLAGNFTSLTAFFVEDKALSISQSFKKTATVSILALSTASVFFFGTEFLAEPTRSIFWIMWGIILLGLGLKNAWPHFRYFGIGVFCGLIAKFYLFDVWDWDMWVKFLAFFTLGAGLLTISYFYNQKPRSK